MTTRGLRPCPGHCAHHDQCDCPDASARHGDQAPALTEAIRRLATRTTAEEATRAD